MQRGEPAPRDAHYCGGSSGPRTRLAGVVAQVAVTVVAAAIHALATVVCLLAGIFGQVSDVPTFAFGLSAVVWGTCTVLAVTRQWRWGTWVSSLALLSSVIGTSAVAGQHTAYSWPLVVAAGASVLALIANLFRAVTWSVPRQRSLSVALFGITILSAGSVVLFNPTPRPLPTDAGHARAFLNAYRGDFAAVARRASSGKLTVGTEDGLAPLSRSICHIAARCEVQVDHLASGDVLFIPTYINWRNEYAGGLIRSSSGGRPPRVESFTADVTPLQEVGDGWWWSEPR